MTPTDVLRAVFEHFRAGDRTAAVALFHRDASFTYTVPAA